MTLYRDMTDDAIQASLREDRDSTHQAAMREMEELLIAYGGGQDMERFLVRRPGEQVAVAGRQREERYLYRKRRAHNPNYFARLTDAIVDGFVGDKIERHIEGEADSVLQDLLSECAIDMVQQEYGLSTVLLGNALVAIAGNSDMVGIAPVHPLNYTASCDPMRPYRLAEVVEKRGYFDRSENERFVYWVWNDAWGRCYDQSGRRLNVDPITGEDTDWADPNPYGVVPYVHWRGRPMVGSFSGLSYVRDQLSLQKELYNRTNDLMVLCHLRSFGVPVFKDFQGDQLDWSEYGALEVGPQGDAWMLEPSGNVDGMLLSLDRLVDWMFQTGGVPVDVVKGQVAESGVALMVKWQPYVRVVQTLRTQGQVSEQDMVRKLCAVGRYHGYALPEDPVVTVEYDDAIVPNDTIAEFQRDLLMLNNEPPLMTREDFLRKWHDLDDDGALAEYIEKLDASSAATEPEADDDAFGLGGLAI